MIPARARVKASKRAVAAESELSGSRVFSCDGAGEGATEGLCYRHIVTELRRAMVPFVAVSLSPLASDQII